MRAFIAAASLAAAAAQGYGPIVNLPGYSGSAKMASGYITVNATNGRALFFWFVEAATPNPATSPVVFWTNGGPGCSSLGGGFFSEHGPVRPAVDGTLVDNPWSWHNAANMLYVEQPAGVGFSYSNTSSDYVVGDQRSWEDMYSFIQGWLAAYPAYRNNDFYVTGESYGGHYVPGFAAYIVDQNAQGVNPKVNLAGMMVGNAWTNAAYDNTGAVEQWYAFSQISNDSYNGILRTCNMSDVGPLFARSALRSDAFTETVNGVTLRVGAKGFKSRHPSIDGVLPTYKDQTCDQWQTQANNEQGNVDIYDLYSNVCTGNNILENTTLSALGGDSNVQAGCAADYNPCIDSLTSAYLNRADVQAAIHVVPALVPGGSWVGCTNIINYSYTDLLSSMLPVYDYLLTNFATGKFLVYSGDVDGIVPVKGTRDWLASFNYPVSSAFAPWNTPEGQVAGYTYSFTAPSGAILNFASIRNAGHLCPTLQGSRTLQLFTTFLTTGAVVA